MGINTHLWMELLLSSQHRHCAVQKKFMQQNLKDKLGKYIETDYHEDLIAAEVVDPRQIDVSLDDIGGLEDVKHTLVILSSLHPDPETD